MDVGSHLSRAQRSGRHLLERDRVLDRLLRRVTPHERAVRGDENSGPVERLDVEADERLQDHLPGRPLVLTFDLRGGERARDGDGAVEVVCVCRPVAGDLVAGLRPCGGERRVRVNDAPHVEPGAIEDEVGGRVRRGPHLAVHHCAALDVDDGDLGGREPVVGDTARLDRDHARVAVDGARIPEGEDDEPCAAERHVRLEHAFAQLDVMHGYSPPASR